MRATLLIPAVVVVVGWYVNIPALSHDNNASHETDAESYHKIVESKVFNAMAAKV